LGVALRAGLLRAPLPLGPAKTGLLRTLHIPNATPTSSARWQSSLCHGVKVRSRLRRSLLLGLRPRLHLDLPCPIWAWPPAGNQAANHRSAGCNDLEKTTMKRKTKNAGNNYRDGHRDLETTSLPISYHPGVSDSFDGWAESCGFHPETLRHATEFGIRHRHPEAIPEDARYKHRPDSADIFRLSLGTVDVYYSIEGNEAVVRGYGWEIAHEPLDDRDGGGHYVD